jgi:Family of unknown function (DUF6069)
MTFAPAATSYSTKPSALDERTKTMTSTTIRIRPLLATGAVAAAATAAVNASIFGLGRAAGVDFVVDSTTTVAVADVVSFTLMCFAAGLLAAVIARWVRRPSYRVLQVVGAVIAVASVAMDVPLDGSPAATVLLASMHLVTGAAYVIGLEIAHRRSTAAVEQHPAAERRPQPIAA